MLQSRLLIRPLLHPLHGAGGSVDFRDLFFDESVAITEDHRSLYDLREAAEKLDLPARRRTLRLCRDVLLPVPWHQDRLVGSLSSIGVGKRGGPWRQDQNHAVELLLPFGLGLVHGGNHSLAAGIIDGEGEVDADERDITLAYPHVRFDGANFRRRHGDQSVISTPKHVEAGWLFEVGRLMVERHVTYDAPMASEDRRWTAFDKTRKTVLFEVAVNDVDTGMSIQSNAIEEAMLAGGVERGSAQWQAVFFDETPWVDSNGTRWTFKPYGPRLIAEALAHIA